MQVDDNLLFSFNRTRKMSGQKERFVNLAGPRRKWWKAIVYERRDEKTARFDVELKVLIEFGLDWLDVWKLFMFFFYSDSI